jgi:hypothetical protein
VLIEKANQIMFVFAPPLRLCAFAVKNFTANA